MQGVSHCPATVSWTNGVLALSRCNAPRLSEKECGFDRAKHYWLGHVLVEAKVRSLSCSELIMPSVRSQRQNVAWLTPLTGGLGHSVAKPDRMFRDTGQQ